MKRRIMESLTSRDAKKTEGEKGSSFVTNATPVKAKEYIVQKTKADYGRVSKDDEDEPSSSFESSSPHNEKMNSSGKLDYALDACKQRL